MSHSPQILIFDVGDRVGAAAAATGAPVDSSAGAAAPAAAAAAAKIVSKDLALPCSRSFSRLDFKTEFMSRCRMMIIDVIV